MPLTLDHIVVLVHELEAAIADYTQLGFTVQRGGSHADGATQNALVGFDDGSYLELLAFVATTGAHRWARARDAGTQGFVDFALLPSDTGSTIAATRLRGLEYDGPVAGGRVRPDGQQVAWESGFPPTTDLPFLCGDLTPRSLRVPEGTVRVHPNGVTGVRALSIAVRDLDASLARYAALLGIDVRRDVARSSLPGLGLRSARLTLGAAELWLLSPIADDKARTMDPVHARIATHGQGVVGLALAQAGGTFAHRLPLNATHGAPIELHPKV